MLSMDNLKLLCELSKLHLSEDEMTDYQKEMTDIINLMDTIKDFDISYDDTKDKNEIAYDDLRKDEAKPSFDTEKLQQNTNPRDNCYVVPKMME